MIRLKAKNLQNAIKEFRDIVETNHSSFFKPGRYFIVESHHICRVYRSMPALRKWAGNNHLTFAINGGDTDLHDMYKIAHLDIVKTPIQYTNQIQSKLS